MATEPGRGGRRGGGRGGARKKTRAAAVGARVDSVFGDSWYEDYDKVVGEEEDLSDPDLFLLFNKKYDGLFVW